jgi:hypothetical protein
VNNVAWQNRTGPRVLMRTLMDGLVGFLDRQPQVDGWVLVV